TPEPETVAGLKLADAPAGSPDVVKPTVPENPLSGVIVTRELTVQACQTVWEDGEAPIEKSPWALTAGASVPSKTNNRPARKRSNPMVRPPTSRLGYHLSRPVRYKDSNDYYGITAYTAPTLFRSDFFRKQKQNHFSTMKS